MTMSASPPSPPRLAPSVDDHTRVPAGFPDYPQDASTDANTDASGSGDGNGVPTPPPMYNVPSQPITGQRLPRWAGWAVPVGFAIGGAVALPSGVSPGLVVLAVLLSSVAFIYAWARAIEARSAQ